LFKAWVITFEHERPPAMNTSTRTFADPEGPERRAR
jgi:hypothetical protein